MAKLSKPRAGSLQYWPRKRARKFLPSVNWKVLEEKNPEARILGLIGYKVGMTSILVKDNTPDSLTKGKRKPVPATVIEFPSMKIFSVRFYKKGNVVGEVLTESADKELKKRLKLPKRKGKNLDEVKDYDDIRVLGYSVVKQTGVKKTPDIVEIGLTGNLQSKLEFVKDKIGKEIFVSDIFKPMQLVDIRGLTKGKGLQGPVKRFGITLKQHKSEKGVRRPGSLAPWHPNMVTYRTPMAGQLGLFSRIQYNGKVLMVGKIKEKEINPKGDWKNYGKIKTEYMVLYGSVQGPQKRPLLITSPLRVTKEKKKENYEVIGLI